MASWNETLAMSRRRTAAPTASKTWPHTSRRRRPLQARTLGFNARRLLGDLDVLEAALDHALVSAGDATGAEFDRHVATAVDAVVPGCIHVAQLAARLRVVDAETRPGELCRS